MFQKHLLTKFLLEYQVNIHIIARVYYKYRFNNLFGLIHQCILRIFNYVPFKYLILILLMSILFVVCLLRMHNCVSLEKWRLLNIYLFHIPYSEIYIWHYVRDWIGVCGVDQFDTANHFVQFTYLLGGAATRRSFMQLLWLLCVCVLWFELNNRRFNNTQNSIHQLVEKVQMHSYRC